jgi:hypothetical protein
MYAYWRSVTRLQSEGTCSIIRPDMQLVFLQHDNVKTHTTARTTRDSPPWFDCLGPPTIQPKLAPSHFHLLTKLKNMWQKVTSSVQDKDYNVVPSTTHNFIVTDSWHYPKVARSAWIAKLIIVWSNRVQLRKMGAELPIFSLLPLLKEKCRLIRSPSCLRVCLSPPPNNFWTSW